MKHSQSEVSAVSVSRFFAVNSRSNALPSSPSCKDELVLFLMTLEVFNSCRSWAFLCFHVSLGRDDLLEFITAQMSRTTPKAEGPIASTLL